MARLRTENRFPVGGGYYAVPVGCSYEVTDPANVPQALQKLRGSLTPATMAQCEGWLVMLQAACARRPDSEASSAVAYALYASHLRQYPADVAKAACEQLARGKGGVTWFPTLGEVADACEQMAAPRRMMLAGLEQWTKPAAELTYEPLPHDKTAENKQRVRTMLEEYQAQLRALEAAKPVNAPLPAIHGKTDETGITPELRAVIERQRA